MTPTLPSPVSAGLADPSLLLTFVLLLVAPLLIAGVSLINTGLGRSRSAAQALLGNLAIVAVSAVVFALIGAAFTGSLPGGVGHTLHLAGKSWNWLGAGPAPQRLRLRSCSVPARRAL
jgi:ammonia channel protein AmtB